MANPLAAFGQLLQTKAGQQHDTVYDAVINDDAVAIARFISAGAVVDDVNEVCILL
jgi:hypothetical protein